MPEDRLRPSSELLVFPDHWKVMNPTAKPEVPKAAGESTVPAQQSETASAVEIPMTPSTRILIAEDDSVSRRILAARLLQWGFEPVITRDGNEAMNQMRSGDAPAMAILDWMMPGMDGVEVCRRLRSINKRVYIIMLTAMKEKEHVSEALNAGADDYVAKPWEPLELEARVKVGLRIIGLQTALAQRVTELETTVKELQELKGNFELPI